MIYLIILVTGLVAFIRLPLELMPGVDFPRLTVYTTWPNGSPEAVEAFVTSPIEGVCNTIKGRRRVSSSSQVGISTVTIEFAQGTDMDFAALELNEKLSIVRESLPYGTTAPQIQKYIPSQFEAGTFLQYNVTGNMDISELRRFAFDQLRGPLMSVDGVSEVEIIGGLDPVVQIELNPEKMASLDIDPLLLLSALQEAGLQTSSGQLVQGQTRYNVRIDHHIGQLSDLEQIYLNYGIDRIVRIGDIGRVSMTYNTPRSIMRIDGTPAVVINIHKEAGYNTIRVADQVYQSLQRLQSSFGEDIRIIKVQDQSEQIRNELGDLTVRIGLIVFIVFLVLLVFLRQFKSPLIILSTIFFAVLMTANLFFIANLTLNLLTLAGLALGFGMLVDNSVIVLDNIYRHYELGKSPQDAAQYGVSEVLVPVIAATLTTIAALVPFVYMTGEIRIYYLPFVIAVSLSLFSSLLVAFSFTPSLTANLLSTRKEKKQINARMTAHNLIKPRKIYAGTLAWSLKHKTIVICIVIMTFIASAYLFNKYVYRGQVWSPYPETYIRVRITMPTGTEISRTDAVAAFFEEASLEEEQIKQVLCTITPEYGTLNITFPDSIEHTTYPLMLQEKLIFLATTLGGARVSVYGYGSIFSQGGGSTMSSYQIRILGYNYTQVKQIAEGLKNRLQKYARVDNINTNVTSMGYLEDITDMVLEIDRDRLSSMDIDLRQVLFMVQRYLNENFSRQTVTIGNDEMDLQIKIEGIRDLDVNALMGVILETGSGSQIRLSEIAHIAEHPVMNRIDREDQQYMRVVSFDYRGPAKLGGQLTDAIIESTQLPPGYKLERSQLFGIMTQEETSQIYMVLIFSLLFVFIITAGVFESFIYPFIVLLTVPMGLIGVFLIYWLTGTTFDRGAYIGLVLLGGIVVNDAILLVAHIRQLHLEGQSIQEAITHAAQNRMRPILMTSLTTIFGLIPLIIKVQEGSIWSTLALSTVGGLTSSTFLVLFITPVLYLTVEESKKRIYQCKDSLKKLAASVQYSKEELKT